MTDTLTRLERETPRRRDARLGAPPVQLLDALAEALEPLLANPQLRLALAGDAHTPPALLDWLVRDARDEVRLALARNPATPTEVLLALTRSEYLCPALAHNPGAPPILLAALVEHWDAGVRRALARNPNTPATLLAKLARDRDLWVRHGVACNPGTPPTALRQLAEGNEPCLCRALARNARTPVEVLERLVEHNDPVIWARLAQRRARQAAQPEPVTHEPASHSAAGRARLTTFTSPQLSDKALSYA